MISRYVDVFYRTQRPINSQGEEYKLVTPGASIRFGVPFSEYDTVFFGIGFEQTKIEGSNLPVNYRNYVTEFGSSSNSVPLTIGWSRGSRDSALVPTAGRLTSVNFDWGLTGDAKYLRTNGKFQQYIPLSKRFTFGFNADLSWARASAATRIHLQEFLRRWSGQRARLRPELARPGRRDRRLHRRQPQVELEQRVVPADSGDRQ